VSFVVNDRPVSLCGLIFDARRSFGRFLVETKVPQVTDVTVPSIAITDKPQPPLQNADMQTEVLSVLRLDYLSCVLTILSTILIGRRCWEGWVVAAVNSLIICIIGIRTAQLGFVPANLFCIALYALNLRTWRKAGIP
jgi:hypothetical protein